MKRIQKKYLIISTVLALTMSIGVQVAEILLGGQAAVPIWLQVIISLIFLNFFVAVILFIVWLLWGQ